MPTYKIRTGDTPERISAKFGMTVPDLYKANQGTYQYRTGTTIKIPGTGKATPANIRYQLRKQTGVVTTESPTGAERYKRMATPTAMMGGTTGWTPTGWTNKPATATAGGGVVYPTAEDIYISSGAHTREVDWSKTMGANLGPITADDWRRGVRPERITAKNAKEIGVEDNWMRENGYVLIGDTWCRASQGGRDYPDESGNIPVTPPTTGTTSTGGPYTENVQWRVSTG